MLNEKMEEATRIQHRIYSHNEVHYIQHRLQSYVRTFVLTYPSYEQGKASRKYRARRKSAFFVGQEDGVSIRT